MTELIDRPTYLDDLQRWRDRPIVKVVTGVRRCGKSTLLTLFRRRLLDEGVPPSRILELNMEDLANAALAADYRALHQHIVDRLEGTGTTYVFLDEIQLVEGFERAIDSLHLRQDVDLYLTGSNAQMLSGDLASLISGRYVELRMLPLSFAEYVAARRSRAARDQDVTLPALYGDYLTYGSFPFVVELAPDRRAVDDYLDGLVATILLKDVSKRLGIANPTLLQDVAAFLFSNVGSLTSLRRIADALSSMGRVTGEDRSRRRSPHTVERYVTGLSDAYLFYPVERWDVQGLRRLAGPAKYYAVDPGMRHAMVGYAGRDLGRVLENVVYLELRRRHRRVTVGRSGRGEIDFVVGEGGDVMYVQVAQSVLDPATLDRELAPLLAVRDHRHKVLLTLDAGPNVTHDGIVQTNALTWLATAPPRSVISTGPVP
ncbi:MAG: ATP-binding protein [Bifidobacteriaceae bacterium]|jgi:predicted AAA+ superfamily ATPase|nr:ATP-binding protein [Bifidobacteriaceae bacterium]